jgi:addiction module RelE/StbE family toxin
MKLLWTLLARRDRRAIFNYIYQDNPNAAADMDDVFVKAAQQLSYFPQSGRTGRVQDTRELLVHPSYFIVYDLAEDTVRVLAIIHTARQWPPE